MTPFFLKNMTFQCNVGEAKKLLLIFSLVAKCIWTNLTIIIRCPKIVNHAKKWVMSFFRFFDLLPMQNLRIAINKKILNKGLVWFLLAKWNFRHGILMTLFRVWGKFSLPSDFFWIFHYSAGSHHVSSILKISMKSFNSFKS